MILFTAQNTMCIHLVRYTLLSDHVTDVHSVALSFFSLLINTHKICRSEFAPLILQLSSTDSNENIKFHKQFAFEAVNIYSNRHSKSLKMHFNTKLARCLTQHKEIIIKTEPYLGCSEMTGWCTLCYRSELFFDCFKVLQYHHIDEVFRLNSQNPFSKCQI